MSNWTSHEDMTGIERYLMDSAGEEAPLFELTLPTRVWVRDGEYRDFPLQDPAELSRVLLSWLDAGMIGVYRFDPQPNTELAFDEATVILGSPEDWKRPELSCATFLTEVGLRARPW